MFFYDEENEPRYPFRIINVRIFGNNLTELENDINNAKPAANRKRVDYSFRIRELLAKGREYERLEQEGLIE